MQGQLILRTPAARALAGQMRCVETLGMRMKCNLVSGAAIAFLLVTLLLVRLIFHGATEVLQLVKVCGTLNLLGSVDEM